MPHLWPTGSSAGSPPRLRPGTSPQTLQIPPRGGHPVLRLSNGQNANLGTAPWQFPLFPTSCPFRGLLILVPRPATNYRRFRIWRSSFERQRDSNPPDLGAAQHTLCPPPTSHRASAWTSLQLAYTTPAADCDPRPDETSPVPQMAVAAFRSPYAGGFLEVADPESSPLPWPSRESRRSAPSCSPCGASMSTLQESRNGTDYWFALLSQEHTALHHSPLPGGNGCSGSSLRGSLAITPTGLAPVSHLQLCRAHRSVAICRAWACRLNRHRSRHRGRRRKPSSSSAPVESRPRHRAQRHGCAQP